MRLLAAPLAAIAAQAGEPRRGLVPAHAEWDRDLPLHMTRASFALLTGAPYRRWIEVAERTHSLLMEKNRLQPSPRWPTS